MSLQASGSIVALPDLATAATTFATGGTDRLDLTTFNYDVKVEFERPNGSWDGPIRLPGGLHKSYTGLALSYGHGGVKGFRLSNWTAGKQASVDFEAYSIDEPAS